MSNLTGKAVFMAASATAISASPAVKDAYLGALGELMAGTAEAQTQSCYISERTFSPERAIKENRSLDQRKVEKYAEEYGIVMFDELEAGSVSFTPKARSVVMLSPRGEQIRTGEGLLALPNGFVGLINEDGRIEDILSEPGGMDGGRAANWCMCVNPPSGCGCP